MRSRPNVDGYAEGKRCTEQQWLERRAATVIYVSSHLGKGWKIVWSSGKETYGGSDDETKRIILSRTLLERMKWDDMLEIVVHEVAHALTAGVAEDHHGPAWRKKMRDLGR